MKFQDYQLKFCRHLRKQKALINPASERWTVYQQGAIDNFSAILSACFPITKAIVQEKKWRSWIELFLRLKSSGTPIFHELPELFVAFLTQRRIPRYLQELAHYEWVELKVSQDIHLVQRYDYPSNWLNAKLELNPTAVLCAYQYAVHEISSDNIPSRKKASFLLVYRSLQGSVKFFEVNELTFALLTTIQETSHSSGEVILKAFLPTHFDWENWLSFGQGIFDNLYGDDILWGIE